MSKIDVYQEITNSIVEAMESAGELQLPWVKNKGSALRMPKNVASGNAYNGINIVSLWASAMKKEYVSNLWGTYKQWQAQGAQVRKGEKSSLIVFYKPFEVTEEDSTTGEENTEQRYIARPSWVFNQEQVEGFEPASVVIPETVQFTPIENAETFIKQTGAQVQHQGDRAFYRLSTDSITMPEMNRFTGTDTTTPAEGYYATLMHELTHWTGHSKRLDRDLKNRFGSEAYAMEELVAELGAAFLCHHLEITQEPRIDHAQYIKHWLKVLKDDKKAIFTAASKASQAMKWLKEQVEPMHMAA